MFMTLPGLLIILAVHVLIGTAIGSFVTLAVYRKYATRRTLLWTCLTATVCWIYALHLGDLAGVSGYESRNQWEMLPWREGTRWRNLIGDHEYWFALIVAVFASVAIVLIRLKLVVKRTA